ncbi:MAG TPA: hypothetical protein VNK95_21210 [Caldilineaceae bacterium]|nr:hypothetical protein [Caldilineaceae bacterium]
MDYLERTGLMSLPANTPQLSRSTIVECQQRIRELLESLREIEWRTGMQGWSAEIRASYLATLDQLAILEAHLHLLAYTLQTREDNGDELTR